MRARPVGISVITGALATAATAAGAFGWHLPPDVLAGAVSIVGVVLGQLSRQNLNSVTWLREQKQAAAPYEAVEAQFWPGPRSASE